MFAPALHPAMKSVAPIRKELGFRTIFNLLGPLVNPAGATHQVVGVFDEKYLMPVAQAARALGTNQVMVVHNSSGIDEVAPIGSNAVVAIQGERLTTLSIVASDCGMAECLLSDLAGGDSVVNAAITRRIFDGVGGPPSDVVAMNAALAFLLSCRVNDMRAGVKMAREIISSGAARAKLEQFVEHTRSCNDA
jgi:anthranilate phosphoribosyltransferase